MLTDEGDRGLPNGVVNRETQEAMHCRELINLHAGGRLFVRVKITFRT
jgi:hypothetical protein